MKLYADGSSDLMEFIDGKSGLDTWPFWIRPAVDPARMWDWLEYFDQDDAYLVEIKSPPRNVLVSGHGIGKSTIIAWLYARVPVQSVSKRMGHANPVITMKVYAHVLDETDQDRLKLVEEYHAAGLE